MTAVALLPYSHEYYDTLPDIMDAGINVGTTAAAEALSTSIGKLFVEHNVENELGIILLHNHFAMSTTEMLVQFGNAAVPWNIDYRSPELAKVASSSWRFMQQGLAPYEFRYTGSLQKAPPTLSPECHGAFLARLADVLAQYNLLDVLGLCALDDRDIDAAPTIEVTSGRANITLDVDIDPGDEVGTDKSIEAIWQFGTKKGPSGEPVVFKKYKVACKIRNNQHTGIHQTTKK